MGVYNTAFIKMQLIKALVLGLNLSNTAFKE